jgi:hypothetical protein
MFEMDRSKTGVMITRPNIDRITIVTQLITTLFLCWISEAIRESLDDCGWRVFTGEINCAGLLF